MGISHEQTQNWATAMMVGQPDARDAALATTLEQIDALLDEGHFAPLLAAATALPDGDERLAPLLSRLSSKDTLEALAGGWEQTAVRRAGLALALRHGDALPTSLASLLIGELAALDDDDQDLMEDLSIALDAACRDTISPTAGLCARETVDWLDRQPRPRQKLLISRLAHDMGAAYERGALPEPIDACAMLATTLLESPHGKAFLTTLATHLDITVPAAASRLATLCVEAWGALNVDASDKTPDDAEPEDDRADADAVRGMLDAFQIPYNDLTGDTWSARIAYKDAFEQRVHADLHVGLTARRVLLRVVAPRPTTDMVKILSQNHYSGLVSFSLDTSRRLTLTAQTPREGFNWAFMEQALDELRTSLEWLENL